MQKTPPLPYNNYGTYLRSKYEGKQVYKVIVDGGFTCPNRDGTKGRGGCTYCNVDSFTPLNTRTYKTIAEQLERNMEFAAKRFGAELFIVYFQPNTNTYAPVETLKTLYDHALSINSDKIVGLSVGTRADCLDEEKLQLFNQYASTGLDVDLEIGMESMYDATLKTLNRQHTHQEFLDMMHLCKDRKFETCVHTIFGLQGETQEMQLAVAEQLNDLPIKYAKLHHLYIVTGSIMGVEYKRNPEKFQLYSLEAYTDFLCQLMPRLRPDIVIQRLFGISDPAFHLAPSWGLPKAAITNYINDAFIKRGVVQGSQFTMV